MQRLRIFAGPNGAGKSTLYKELAGRFSHAYYINPDILFETIRKTSEIDLSGFGISVTEHEWRGFYKKHGLYSSAPLLDASRIEKSLLVFKDTPHSYESSILSDFIRHRLLETKATFFFETVFSHSSKLDFMQYANTQGYRCYLYFSAVSSVELCVSRIKQRTQQGGHDVPDEKVRKRYQRSLENLLPALQLAYRAYLFDNSDKMNLVAEMKPSKRLELITKQTPLWLKAYVLDKLPPTN